MCLNHIWPDHLIFESIIYSRGRRLHLRRPVDRVKEQMSFFFQQQFYFLTPQLCLPIPEYNSSTRPFQLSIHPSCPTLDHDTAQRNQPNGPMDWLEVLSGISLKEDLWKN